MPTSRHTLIPYLDTLLNIHATPDSSCNGLQFEGKEQIQKIGLAVNASLSTYKKATEAKCDMLLTHHGFIWGGLKAIRGSVKKHLNFLMKHDLNVYAAHLPLDLHKEFGNNIELARMLKLKNIKTFGKYDGMEIGFQGELSKALSAKEIAKILQKEVGGTSLILPFGKEKNKTVAIVSGGGSKALPEAIHKNIDCFITGESAHQDHHTALEGEINVVYIGHYHSEQHGVLALGKHLEKKFKIKTVYLDDPTLV